MAFEKKSIARGVEASKALMRIMIQKYRLLDEQRCTEFASALQKHYSEIEEVKVGMQSDIVIEALQIGRRAMDNMERNWGDVRDNEQVILQLKCTWLSRDWVTRIVPWNYHCFLTWISMQLSEYNSGAFSQQSSDQNRASKKAMLSSEHCRIMFPTSKAIIPEVLVTLLVVMWIATNELQQATNAVCKCSSLNCTFDYWNWTKRHRQEIQNRTWNSDQIQIRLTIRWQLQKLTWVLLWQYREIQGICLRIRQLKDSHNKPTRSEVLRILSAVIERDPILEANFGQGHCYTCPNGHIYLIGECGRAMEESFCPECGARIGGQHHQLVEDNRSETSIAQEIRQVIGQRWKLLRVFWFVFGGISPVSRKIFGHSCGHTGIIGNKMGFIPCQDSTR